MGIDVFAPGSGQGRSLYLEGYGAVFMLDVGFPLLAPPPRPEQRQEPSRVDSTWAEAERELYGPAIGAGGPPPPAEEYSEQRVNRLKDTLCEALKHASKIRDLKPDESVTVCVAGGPVPAPGRPRPGPNAEGAPGPRPNEALPPEPGNPPWRQTVLTVSAKKADIDALAQGNLTPEDFRRQARIAAYAGHLETGMGAGFNRYGGYGGGVYSGGGFGGGGRW